MPPPPLPLGFDGVRVDGEWHRRPLAEDRPRIDAWHDALARADAVRAGHVPWSFVRPEDDRGPTRPIERHELSGTSDARIVPWELVEALPRA